MDWNEADNEESKERSAMDQEAQSACQSQADRASPVFMKYQPLTKSYATWLYQFISRTDWGLTDRTTGKPFYVNDNWSLESHRCGYSQETRCFPQRITRTTIESHILGTDKAHYVSSSTSGFSLVCVDIDAHQGQTDAFEAACWIRDNYFPEAFLEASKQGFHLYLLVRVGWCPRWRFNEMLALVESKLAELLVQHSFTSTVEIMGGFTVYDEQNAVSGRAHLAPLPLLTNGTADLAWMISMPVYLISALATVVNDSALFKEVAGGLANPYMLDDCGIAPFPSQKRHFSPARRDSNCAYERMVFACFDFTTTHRKLPTEDELLSYYQEVYQADAGDASRRHRAKGAIKSRSKTFDPQKLSQGGYGPLKEKLLEAVKTHCLDRSSNYKYAIEDEDLAVALYCYHVASFYRHDNPKEQWTVGRNAVIEMFATLKGEGVTRRGCDKSKSIALKLILLRAGLIECFDSEYIAANGKGISKKYTISQSHWLYQAWIVWAADVKVTKVDQIRKNKLVPCLWESQSEASLLGAIPQSSSIYAC